MNLAIVTGDYPKIISSPEWGRETRSNRLQVSQAQACQIQRGKKRIPKL